MYFTWNRSGGGGPATTQGGPAAHTLTRALRARTPAVRRKSAQRDPERASNPPPVAPPAGRATPLVSAARGGRGEAIKCDSLWF